MSEHEPDKEDRAFARNIKRAWKSVGDPERGLAYAIATYRSLRQEGQLSAARADERAKVLVEVEACVDATLGTSQVMHVALRALIAKLRGTP